MRVQTREALARLRFVFLCRANVLRRCEVGMDGCFVGFCVLDIRVERQAGKFIDWVLILRWQLILREGLSQDCNEIAARGN